MPIPIEQARAALVGLGAPQVTNLYAQGHAKHVLQEVGEAPENFPAFDPNLDDKLTFAAYGLLAAGCSLVEQEDRAGGVAPLERAASLLQFVHGPHSSESSESRFHVLVAAMAFYAAGHYSRAFVTIRAIEAETAAARIIAAFLRKDVVLLIQRLNEVLLRDSPPLDDQVDLDQWVITVAISRAVAIALEFIFTGRPESLSLADQQLQDAGVVASAGSHPAWWWVVRLLRLMLDDLGDSSPWRVLPPYFGPDHREALGQYIRCGRKGQRKITSHRKA